MRSNILKLRQGRIRQLFPFFINAIPEEVRFRYRQQQRRANRYISKYKVNLPAKFTAAAPSKEEIAKTLGKRRMS